jgi:E3 ubiquitin-protein ligase UBR4
LKCKRWYEYVKDNNGVCDNCGENVLKWKKCREIKYDEKDNLIWNDCGLCKYEKFDYKLKGRACCDVDKIESEDDRKKNVGNINYMLEKEDSV